MAKKTTSTDKPESMGRRLAYPFYDLENCIAVARVLHERGGGTLTTDQLVPATGHKGKSGSFLTKLASARLFGLISGTEDGRISITDRGVSMVAPMQPGLTDREAKRDAFLAVPLFAAVYTNYNGKPLPPKEGLFSILKSNFGVPVSQVEFAYRSLRSSAGTAGFLEATGGEMTRLVTPVITQRGGDLGKPKPPKDEIERERQDPNSAPRAVQGAVAMLPAEGSQITTTKLNGLVEAYRTACLMSYEIVKDDGA